MWSVLETLIPDGHALYKRAGISTLTGFLIEIPARSLENASTSSLLGAGSLSEGAGGAAAAIGTVGKEKGVRCGWGGRALCAGAASVWENDAVCAVHLRVFSDCYDTNLKLPTR